MTLNFRIFNFDKDGEICTKYICPSHNGGNISPEISWKKVKNAKSYALILEDPDVPSGIFIHWYMPYINKNIDKINQLYINQNQILSKNLTSINFNNFTIIHGKNHTGNLGYYGPCAPPKTGDHRYIFYLYALDGKINADISNHNDFEQCLKDKNINILAKEELGYKYGYKL